MAQRSYLTRFLSAEIYVGLIAIIFLIFGACLSIKLYRPIPNQIIEQSNTKIINRKNFSEREADVLLFMCHGYTYKEIAQQLLITTNSVKTHLKNIYTKLGVSNRTQAAAEAKILNIIGV